MANNPTRKRTSNSSYYKTLKKKYDELQERVASFERSEKVIQLIDPTKSSSTSSSIFSKDTLRTYMQNPSSNSKNLRSLSRFLYYRSQVYRRIINYNANMIDLNMRTVVPDIDFVKGIDEQKMLKSYADTLKVLEFMNLPLEFLKVYITCFREDVFYGCAYLDPSDNTFFILPLDPDYCKITGIYNDGSLSFDMDMSYFTRNSDKLEFWGEPFQTMWNEYQKDTMNGRWQPMPDENCVCLKCNIDDLEIPLPPYLGLFDSLINLEDLREITAIADEQQIYKLLVQKIPLLSNTDKPNDFAIDLDLVVKFYQKMLDTIPDYANAVLSPTELDSIEFNHDQATDVNKIENATKNVTASAGGQALVGGTGSTSVNLSMKLDENFAISSLLPQTEAVVNRLLSFVVSNPSRVHFMEVTSFTKKEYSDNLLKMATYGVPVKTELGVVSGLSEYSVIAKGYLEKALHLDEIFQPLKSSNTMNTGEITNPEGGRPETPDSELTDAGEETRDRN